MYTYRAEILNVVDGDTVDMEIDLGFNIRITERVRLFGIDAPETRTIDHDEKLRGYAATEFLISHIPPDGMVTIKTRFDKRGKFGRILASIFLDDGTDLNLHMVAEGHAEPYMLD